MNVLILCLFIAALLPYLAKIPVAFAMHQAGGYNNHYPREQQSSLTGFGARASAAHKNSFESLLIFAIAILTVLATQTESRFIEPLAITHIIARIAYHLVYLLNLATLRTTIWSIGTIASFVILGICLA